jgi:hypothetical protein
MQITKDTRVSDLLLEYGGITEVMRGFRRQTRGTLFLADFLANALTVE